MTSCIKYLLQQPVLFCAVFFIYALPFSRINTHQDVNLNIDVRKKEKGNWRSGNSLFGKRLGNSHLITCNDWFTFHSALQSSWTIKLNWLDGKFNIHAKLWSILIKLWPMFAENQQMKGKKTEAAGNSLSQHYDNNSCFSGTKVRADSTLLEHPSACWMQTASSSSASGF